LGRDHGIPLHFDLYLVEEAMVDDGKSLVLEARPISHRLTFETFLEFKVWIKEFSFKHVHHYSLGRKNR
jgi:hypothetical protein